MGKGHYRGGSTLVGPGMIWSDHADFPEASTANTRSPKARKKKRQGGMKRGPTTIKEAVAIEQLIIPECQAQLIAAILKDLGLSPPKKRKRFNNVLRNLISDGVITSEGNINKSHPVIQEWFRKVEAQN